MSPLDPIRFTPIFRRYLWGGRRLATVLGKQIGQGDDYAESWEVVDHGPDQSVVAAGPLAGWTLGELLRQRGPELLGKHYPLSQFPLLFKFLDANRNLSVQVHPSDATAARLGPLESGKTEAWVILAAEPGSVLYAGLRSGVDRAALQSAIAKSATATCLHRIEPNVGDCIFLPAGTVHALGEGLLVAEIQQASDTTYRLDDWGRLDTDGLPRPLHIEQALEAIDFTRGPVLPCVPQPTDRVYVDRLVACEKFVLDRWEFDSPQTAGGGDRFHILAVLQGRINVENDPIGEPLEKGGTMVLPAVAGPILLTPDGPTVLLDMYLP